MKRMHTFFLSAVFAVSFIFGSLSTAMAAGQTAKNLREFLVGSKNVSEVYPIDEHLTFVVPKTGMLSGISSDFDQDLLKFCKEQGALEAEFTAADPLTGKESKAWQVIQLDGKDKFVHPATGEEKFKGDMLYRGIVVKGAPTARTRIKDYMEVSEFFVVDKEPRMIIFKTKDKQPFVYKIDSVPPFDKIAIPPNGNLANNVAEMRESRKGLSLFKSRLHLRDADVFVYLTAICIKFNLTPAYLINEGEFVPVDDANIKYFIKDIWHSGYCKIKLKEITSPLTMFKYMADLDLGQMTDKFNRWYFGAAGSMKFVTIGSEERRIDDKGILSSHSQVNFINERDFSGITFTATDKKETPGATATPASPAAPAESAAPSAKEEPAKKEEPVNKDASTDKPVAPSPPVTKDAVVDKPVVPDTPPAPSPPVTDH